MLNERQQLVFDERVVRLNAIIARDSTGFPLPSTLSAWNVREDGRTTYLTFADSDHFAEIILDPYGSGGDSLAVLDWLHREGDYDCPCGHNNEEG